MENFSPDLTFMREGEVVSVGDNRFPGDLKVSWKLKSVWQTSEGAALRREYKQALEVDYM